MTHYIQENADNQEYLIEKTPVGGSCHEDEGRQGTQKITERIHRKVKTSWKAQRKMDTCSGQGCYEDVEIHKLEKGGRGQTCLEAKD